MLLYGRSNMTEIDIFKALSTLFVGMMSKFSMTERLNEN